MNEQIKRDYEREGGPARMEHKPANMKPVQFLYGLLLFGFTVWCFANFFLAIAEVVK
jgi:hypothetical protein